MEMESYTADLSDTSPSILGFFNVWSLVESQL